MIGAASTERITRLRQGKHSRYIFGLAQSSFTAESGASLSTITPSRYAIEVRDKSFNLKRRIEHLVTAVSWEWNRIGGCGRCTLKVDGDYKRFDVAADDDIRIYLPNASSGSTLWYRGYVETVTPGIQTGNKGTIQIECMGYFGLFDRIVVHDSVSPKVYANQEIGQIVEDIVDDFVVANSSVTRGTVEPANFTPDTLSFKGSVKDCLRTLADLVGAVEYGVNASLEFFWMNQEDSLRYVLMIGDKIVKIQDRIDFKNIANKVYFEGGEVGGAAFVTSGQSQSSIDRYGTHEEIISNGSIASQVVADQYMSSLFRNRAAPSRQLSIGIKNTKKRFEVNLPIGACSFVDQDFNQTGAIYGAVADGGSGKIYGTLLNGGSGQVYGGVSKHQIDRISYSLSPEDGKIHADIQFGSSIGVSLASATLKRIEQIQNSLRLRTL